VTLWLKDLIDQRLIKLIHTPTDELVAEMPLNGEKFQYVLFKLLGWNIEVNNNYDFNEEV
jgi:hypothetical protein